jgi:pimeloyl-ACP methyl ester carboxylesterase
MRGAPTWDVSDVAVRLVTIEGPDAKLHGVLLDAGSDAVVVHIHGMCGSYYHNRFILPMLDCLAATKMSALLVNTSGHDYLAETINGDVPNFVGGSVATQAEIDRDLSAIVRAARGRFARIYLQGHSYGCDIIARNVKEGRIAADGMIFLSPADSRALQEHYSGETVAAQRQRLTETHGSTDGPIGPLHLKEVGIRARALSYPIPMTRKAILSFLRDDVRVFRYASEPSAATATGVKSISVPAFAYLGDEDPLLLGRQAIARQVIGAMFDEVTFAAAVGGDHHFTGLEEQIFEEVARWVSACERRNDAVGAEVRM